MLHTLNRILLSCKEKRKYKILEKCMELENIILSEVTDSKDKCHNFSPYSMVLSF